LGKPLKSITHPLRADLSIYSPAEGSKNVVRSPQRSPTLAADVLQPAFTTISTATRSPKDSAVPARAALPTRSRSHVSCR